MNVCPIPVNCSFNGARRKKVCIALSKESALFLCKAGKSSLYELYESSQWCKYGNVSFIESMTNFYTLDSAPGRYLKQQFYVLLENI